MSGTIETINNNIITKLDLIKKIIAMVKIYDLSFNILIENEINSLDSEYNLAYINLLIDYFEFFEEYKTINRQLNPLKQKIQKYHKIKDEYLYNYIINIKKDNIISRIDIIYNQIEKKIYQEIMDADINSKIYNEFLVIMKNYKNIVIKEHIEKVEYEICIICNIKMKINNNKSELYCEKCGSILTLKGTFMEDNMTYEDDYLKNKNSGYDPSKHCRFWIDRIQAKESTDIPEKIINDIKKCLKRDCIKKVSHITCPMIRQYLRQTNNSDYNEHITLIRKIISGINPPQLSEEELQLINIYFNRVIKIFNEIKPLNKINCPYHPYFIYKILEQILNKKKDRRKKRKILSCIHLQSRETLIENDIIWKKICKKVDIFIYKPTDRNY